MPKVLNAILGIFMGSTKAIGPVIKHASKNKFVFSLWDIKFVFRNEHSAYSCEEPIKHNNK